MHRGLRPGTDIARETGSHNNVDVAEWDEVNKELRQHGLSAVNIGDSSERDAVQILGGHAGYTIRQNLLVLMKDCDRRQTLVQDLILTNNRLRQELEDQITAERSTQGQLKDVKDMLDGAKFKIAELEAAAVQQKEQSRDNEDRLADTKAAAQARARQLEQRCRLQDEEMERLRAAARRLELEEERRVQRQKEVFQEFQRRSTKAHGYMDKKLLDIIDSYETELNAMRRQLAGISSKDHADGDDEKQQPPPSVPSQSPPAAAGRTQKHEESVGGGNVAGLGEHESSRNFKELIKSYDRDLRAAHKTIKSLEEANDLLNIELQSRPSLQDYSASKLHVKRLQRVLREHGIKVTASGEAAASAAAEKFSTKVEDIEYMPLGPCRKHLQLTCDLLNLDDVAELEDKLRGTTKMATEFPKLERAMCQVLDVVDRTCSRSQQSGTEQQQRGAHGWSESHWKKTVPILEEWAAQVRQLSELQRSVDSLLVQLLGERGYEEAVAQLPLLSAVGATGGTGSGLSKRAASGAAVASGSGSCASVSRMISLVDHMRLSTDLPVLPGHGVQVREEASAPVLRTIIAHFQHLFDVPSLAGVYPRMSELYTRTGEHQNVLKTLRDLLGLDDKAKSGDIVDAVANVCQSYTSSTYRQLKQLFLEEDLESIVSRLDNERRLMPLFCDIVEQLMDVLEVTRIDQVVPAVRALKLLAS